MWDAHDRAKDNGLGGYVLLAQESQEVRHADFIPSGSSRYS
jgi:hypothetical protein